jgi:hypothetical protein
MQQCWTTSVWLVDNDVNKQHCYARNNGRAFLWIRIGCLWTSMDTTGWFENRLSADVYLATDSFWLEDWVRTGKKREKHVSLYRGRWRHSIIGAGKWLVNDGLCAEVPLWCASGPTACRRIDLMCLEAFRLQEWEWVLEDCHKRSCWKNSIGVSVPRPCGLDVYVCSESCRLCLTVVYWLLECNKVPSWIENPEYVTILMTPAITKSSCFTCGGLRVWFRWGCGLSW